MQALMLGLALAATAVSAPPNSTAVGPGVPAPAIAAITQSIRTINATAAITSIRPSPIPGVEELIADGTVIYVSDNGRYMLHGTLLDMKEKLNLTDRAGSGIRRGLIDAIPRDQRIVFAPTGPVKHRVTVFTDTSCHYCQELHKRIDGFLAKGIEVDYVAYPRDGTDSPAFAQMVAVWCSKDRKSAYEHAIHGEAVPVATCQSPVLAHYKIGQQLGIEGTPAVYTDGGIQVGGLVDPTELAQALDEEASAAAVASAPDTRKAAGSSQ